MKLTYIYPPLFSPYYPMATRMVTGNLQRNEKIDAEFSIIPVKTYESGIHKKVYDQIISEACSKFSSTIGSYMSQKFLSSNFYYVLMTRWKDAVITETNYGTIYDCRDDFLTKMFNDSPSTIIHLGSSNRCWYGKCKFCTYRGLPVMDSGHPLRRKRQYPAFGSSCG